MGSLISHRRIYQSSKGGDRKRGRSKSPDPYKKRSSMNRPVLRLQVKAETLSRRGIPTTNGVSDIQHSTLRKLAQSGMMYDQLLPPQVTNGYRTHTPPPVLRHNLNPPPSHPPHTLPTPSLPLPRLPRRSHSVDALDSMIIIQYVENDSEDHAEGEKEGVGSSHLAGSDSHLARLCYAKMSEVMREEEHFGNITISRDGSPPQITPSTSLGMINVCQRIQDHTHSTERDHTYHSYRGVPDGTDKSYSRSQTPDERSRSTDALSQAHSNYNWRKIQSASEGQVCGGMEWSLGESIMNAMSQHGLTLFNIDNPTSASEHEVNRAWPELKQKMKIWRSQHSLDKLGSSSASEDTMFNPHHNTPITITAH